MRKLIVWPMLITSFFFLSLSDNYATDKINTESIEEFNKKTIRNLFEDLYSSPEMNAEKAKKLIEKYLHKNYIQHVDGKTLYYKDTLPHRLNQLKRIKDIKIVFEHLIAEGDKVFSIHRATGTKLSNGEEIEARVFALFRLKDGKLYFCDELTHMVKGSKEDKDIGSSTN